MIWIVFKRAKLGNQLHLCVLEMVFYLTLKQVNNTFNFGPDSYRDCVKPFVNFMVCLFHAEVRRSLLYDVRCGLFLRAQSCFRQGAKFFDLNNVRYGLFSGAQSR